jgi:hypothetical protein
MSHRDRRADPAAQRRWLLRRTRLGRLPAGQLPDATPRALLADAHAIACCGGALVDVTRRQFDPRAVFPTIYRDERHLATDWGQINDDEDRRAPWRSLAEI